MIAISFLAIIFIGTCLMMTPFATRTGETTDLVDAIFTSTSATCVTGLVTYDTYTHWSIFGQLVILTMIQIGGLGFITFGIYAMVLLRKKIGLKNRELIHDSLNLMKVGGSVKLVKHVVKGTLIIEGTGAALLSTRFIPEFGFLKGIYFSIFHSISAFCNAGFDLMGIKSEFSSLTTYREDLFVNIVIILLIVIGGLGFIVWEDIYVNKWRFKKYMLHTKVVLITTLVLVLGGTTFFYLSESGGILENMNYKGKLLSSFFSSVTPRTAGFNTLDTALLSDAGKLMTMIFMFIGGSPGSTAGGVKTTTVAVIVFFIVSYIKRDKSFVAFKRSVRNDTIKRASTVFFINLSLAVIAIIVILLNQQLNFMDVAFEAFSAIGTSGMSTGITRDLTLLSKIVIMLLMFCGRVGSLSFAMSFSDRKKVADIRYPSEDITIG